jgi:hypothetical protein
MLGNLCQHGGGLLRVQNEEFHSPDAPTRLAMLARRINLSNHTRLYQFKIQIFNPPLKVSEKSLSDARL